MTTEKLLQVYEEDTAVIGNALYDYVQNGNFKEYENEHSIELGINELEALREGKTIFLNLGEESEFFESKDNVRLISIELDSFKVDAFRSKVAELKVTHMGTSILSKGSNDFIFNLSGDAAAVTWITRLNMVNSSSTLIKESSTNAGLLENIMGKDLSEGTLLFNRVGAKGIFSLKLENATDAEISAASLKIKYSYSLK